MNSLPFSVTPTDITVVYNGSPYTVLKGAPTFNAIAHAIKNGYWDRVPDLLDIPKAVARYTEGKVEVFDDGIHYGGQPLYNGTTAMIMRLMSEGYPIQPFLRFLDKVMANPIESARDEALLFAADNRMPLFEDGDLLAYKAVRPDFKDWHSNSKDNSVGQTVVEDNVDTDRNNTCSNGLHFCSLDYLKHFHEGKGHVVIVKVNPADIRAIPIDYNNSKGRTRQYTVVGIHKAYDPNNRVEVTDRAVVDDDLSWLREPDAGNEVVLYEEDTIPMEWSVDYVVVTADGTVIDCWLDIDLVREGFEPGDFSCENEAKQEAIDLSHSEIDREYPGNVGLIIKAVEPVD